VLPATVERTPVQPDEHLLGQVFCLLGRPDEAQQDPIDSGPVPAEENGEGGLVSLSKAFE